MCAALAALPVALAACRRDPTPPEPAEVAAPPTSAPVARCPPQPEWAPLPDDDPHLVAEILFQPTDAGGRKGSGMRIFDTAFSTAYDEFRISFEKGKMHADPVPGRWLPKGPVSKARLDELQKLIDGVDLAELSEWQGVEKRGTKKPSFLRVRRTGGQMARGCWRGNDGSTAQQRLESLIKTIIGEAGEAAEAAASASAKARPGKPPLTPPEAASTAPRGRGSSAESRRRGATVSACTSRP